MADKDNSRNEVEIDLDKYMALIDKLDKSEDTIKEMKAEALRDSILMEQEMDNKLKNTNHNTM